MNEKLKPSQVRLAQAVDVEVRATKHTPGSRMSNNGIILAMKEAATEMEYARHFIVLAVNSSSNFQPFAVWTRIVGVGQNADGRSYHRIDYCVSGDYHRDLQDALNAYEARKR